MIIMHKKILTISLALAMSISPAASVYADREDDLRQEQAWTAEQLDAAYAQIDNMYARKQQLAAEINSLDADLVNVMVSIQTLENDIAAKESDINVTKGNIKKAEKGQKKQYTAMKKRIQYLYENGEVEYIDTLMSSASFTDMLNKSEYVEQISSYDQKQLNALIQTRQDIQDYEATLEKDLKEVESVKADLETEKDNLNTTITEKNNKIAEYSKDIDAQTAMVEQYQKEIDAADAEMAAIQKRLDEQRAAQQQSGGSSGSSEPQYYTPSGGSYMWPATQGSRISSYFGPRSSPTAGASSNHKGIDIPCPTGSDIVASAAGTVVVSQYSSSAGYYIMIDHGNGVSTVYMHNSQLVVSVGQSVEQGQVIAKAGSTGYSTGSHCHFGVMINGSYVNPLDYL